MLNEDWWSKREGDQWQYLWDIKKAVHILYNMNVFTVKSGKWWDQSVPLANSYNLQLIYSL